MFFFCHMAANGQDEVNSAFWLATHASKMLALILAAAFAHSGDCLLVPAKVKFFGVIFWPYNKSFIDQACLIKMAGYWPRSNILRFYGLRRTILNSRLVNKAYNYINMVHSIARSRWGGGCWVGVCGTLPETFTLFQTKICDFPYPISRLASMIKNLIPYFRPTRLA